MNFPTTKIISEWFVKPKYEVDLSKKPYYLSPWDLIFLPMNYAEHGLLYKKPKDGYSTDKFLERLRDSLALALIHFYPLAGQLVTEVDEEQHRCMILVDCNKGPGVKFTHATLDMTVFELLSETYVPPVVKHLFDHDHGQINYDGHTKPLLSIQITELTDGVFLGMSINHLMADGIAHWKFLHCWSTMFIANGDSILISKPPILQRWVPKGYGPKDLYFPYINPQEFITWYEPPPLKERFFYLSSDSVQNLKSKIMKEGNNQFKISSFQAVLALVWRSIMRARHLPPKQVTTFRIIANDRTKIHPPLPDEYFGNALSVIIVGTTVGELIDNGLCWTAQLVHNAVTTHHEKDPNEFFQNWFKSPYVLPRSASVDAGAKSTLQVGSSPRSNLYENQFGSLGRPIGIRTGNANKFDGKVYAHPGIEGGNSMELDICLSSETMAALESDDEFMSVVSCSPYTEFVA